MDSCLLGDKVYRIGFPAQFDLSSRGVEKCPRGAGPSVTRLADRSWVGDRGVTELADHCVMCVAQHHEIVSACGAALKNIYVCIRVDIVIVVPGGAMAKQNPA